MSATHRDAAGFASKLRLGGLLVLLLAAGLSASSTASARKPAVSSPERESQRVELNAAGVEELCTLPGIGPKKAEAIIAFRERKAFTRVTQLLLVRGIGVKTLRRLRPLIYVAPPSAPKPRALSKVETPAPVPVPVAVPVPAPGG